MNAPLREGNPSSPMKVKRKLAAARDAFSAGDTMCLELIGFTTEDGMTHEISGQKIYAEIDAANHVTIL